MITDSNHYDYRQAVFRENGNHYDYQNGVFWRLMVITMMNIYIIYHLSPRPGGLFEHGER